VAEILFSEKTIKTLLIIMLSLNHNIFILCHYLKEAMSGEEEHVSRKENLRPILFLVIYSFFIIAVSLMMLWSLGGAEDLSNLWLFFTASIMILISMAGIIGERLQRGFDWFDSILHEPELGLLGWIPVVRDPILLTLVSAIIFVVVGMFSVSTNTFFFGATEYSVSPAAKVGLFAEPASWAETLFFNSLILGTVAGLVGHFFIKNKKFMIVALLIGALVTGLVIMPGYHVMKYGERQAELLSTALFGVGSCTLTVLTGSIIPAYIWHFNNNFFMGVKETFGADAAYIIGFLVIILLVIILISYYNFRYRRLAPEKMVGLIKR